MKKIILLLGLLLMVSPVFGTSLKMFGEKCWTNEECLYGNCASGWGICCIEASEECINKNNSECMAICTRKPIQINAVPRELTIEEKKQSVFDMISAKYPHLECIHFMYGDYVIFMEDECYDKNFYEIPPKEIENRFWEDMYVKRFGISEGTVSMPNMAGSSIQEPVEPLVPVEDMCTDWSGNRYGNYAYGEIICLLRQILTELRELR